MAYLKLRNSDFNSAIQCRPGPKAAQSCRTCIRAWRQINHGAQDPLSGLHPKPRALGQSRASKRCSQGRIYHLIRSSKSLRAECLHGSNQDCWIRKPWWPTCRRSVCVLNAGNFLVSGHHWQSSDRRWYKFGPVSRHRGTKRQTGQGNSDSCE